MLDDLWRYSPVGAVPIVVAGVLLLVALVALALSDVPRSRTWVRWLLVFAVAGVVVLTLLGPGAGATGVNLQPGRTIREELVDDVNHSLGVANVIGNVLLFVPLGWLLALASRRRLLTAMVVGCGLSVAIEVTQAFIGRAADIDDVILNASGAVLGALVATALVAAGHAAGWRARVTLAG